MTDIASGKQADELFSALSEQLAAVGYECELVVIGGSALLALGVIDRATRDVDLLALRAGDELHMPRPLPPELAAAAERVSRDYGVPSGGLNAGPSFLLDLRIIATTVVRVLFDRNAY